MAFVALLAVAGTSHCATVTLDVPTKSATSNSAVFDAKWVLTKGDQIGLYIQNKTLVPQKLTLAIAGLKPGRYDVYVNYGEFRVRRDLEMVKKAGMPDNTAAIERGYVIRGKEAAELADGIPLETPGRVVPAATLRCVQSLEPKMSAAAKGLEAYGTGEPGRARYTLDQALEWFRSATTLEETYRSVQAFVAPVGKDPVEIDWRVRQTAQGTKDSLARTCGMLQKARARMSTDLTDPLLRNTVVEALTPVEMKTRYFMQKTGPALTVVITNNVDLDISGTVKLTLPDGWKAVAKKPSFSSLHSGRAYTETFVLKRTANGQPVPAKVTAKSTINVTSANGTAVLNLIGYAELERTSPAGAK